MSHVFTPQWQSITALWPVLISGPDEGRRLSWTSDLDVGFAAMMWEVERLDESALLTGELVEQNDTGHVVAERDDADARPVGVDVESLDDAAREVHDELVLGLDAAAQVQQQHDVVQRRTVCTHTHTHIASNWFDVSQESPHSRSHRPLQQRFTDRKIFSWLLLSDELLAWLSV